MGNEDLFPKADEAESNPGKRLPAIPFGGSIGVVGFAYPNRIAR